ncbi:hypothetical protein C0993_008653 [Termitomyces sp. T159_Od127]|nr:hypothetical protein C0993_008653 [Termitomyces sp. T159_Od127]
MSTLWLPQSLLVSLTDVQRAVPATDDEWRVVIARREQLHFFWDPRNGGLWSSPTVRSLRLPLHNPERERDFGFIRDYCRRPRKTRWIQNMQPYLGFWPFHIDWAGPFACLKLDVMPTYYDIDLARFAMLSQKRIEWESLEAKLVKLSTSLVRRSIQAPYEWSELRVPTLPYECGYQGSYPEARQLISAINGSRGAFIALATFLSFAIALDIANNPHAPNHPPSWLVFAECKLGMDSAWLSDINDSFVCDFAPGTRPGVYALYNQATYKEVFAAYVEGNVPLYICWGFKPGWLPDNDIVWRYRPCRAEARAAQEQYRRNLPPWHVIYGSLPPAAGPEISPGPPARSSLHSSPPSYPEPAVSGVHELRDSPESPSPSHQGSYSPVEGEVEDATAALPDVEDAMTLDTWLQMRRDEREECVRLETPQERYSRVEDEMAAEKARCDMEAPEPGVGDYIYVWHRRGTGMRHRAVPRGEWMAIWRFYRPEERFYASCQREWHLVAPSRPLIEDGRFAHAEASRPPPNIAMAEASGPADEPWIIASAPSPPKAAPPPVEDEMTRQWKSYYAPMEHEDDTESEEEQGRKRKKTKRSSMSNKRPPPPDNRNAAHLLRAIDSPATEMSSFATHVVNDKALTFPDVRQWLRDAFGVIVPVPYSGGIQRGIEQGERTASKEITEVTILWRMGMKTLQVDDDIKKCIIDIYHFVHDKTSPLRLSAPFWDYSPDLHRFIKTHRYFMYRRVRQGIHIIGVCEKPLLRQFYLLVLSDPRAVLAMFRLRLDSIANMVRYLIRRGIAFITGKPVRNPRVTPQQTIFPLGIRERGYKFTYASYIHYERKKRDLLEGSYGRAALSAGGLIWRLVRDDVDIKRILRGGPSTHAKPVLELDGCPLVDDELSVEAGDVICGVYQVYTGKLGFFAFILFQAFEGANQQVLVSKWRMLHGFPRHPHGARPGTTMGIGQLTTKLGISDVLRKFVREGSLKTEANGRRLFLRIEGSLSLSLSNFFLT